MMPESNLKAFIHHWIIDRVLAGLSDDDLIDLYLRKDILDPNWPSHKKERNYFGLDPDKYFEGSERDKDMESQTRCYILQFLCSITDPCGIDWKKPEDETIKEFLTE
jgi:hypothetical protein